MKEVKTRMSHTPNMSRIKVGIQQEPLSLSEISEWCRDPEAGAVLSFEGTTRNNFEDKKVLELSYECYQEMALKEMLTLCDQTLQKFNEIRKVALVHRIGVVKVEECSVICAVSSEHRKQSFEACEWMMNQLKARVPVWKKEIYEGANQQAEWKVNKEAFDEL